MKKISVLILICLSCFMTIAQTTVNSGEKFINLADDGAWCWFADPRAVYHEGEYKKIYSGWVDSEGSIWVGSRDVATGISEVKKLMDKLDQDDHANPSLLVRPDGRIAIFYSAHGGTKNTPMYYQVSQKPEDISSWGEVQMLTQNTEGPMGFCYPNPVQLSSENNRTYLFWRGGNFKPNFSYSDNGKDWSTVQTLIQSDEDKYVRPYLKVSSNNKEKIHFAFTDGHPRNEMTNSIYYMRYENGNFSNVKGKKICSIEDAPVQHSACDVVYNAEEKGAKAWIWDVAEDKNGYPVIVYATFPADNRHDYNYARWDGEKWQNHKICYAGEWFPRGKTNKENSEYESNYSGGLYLDHENPNVVYVSVPRGDVFEIERWETSDLGASWNHEAITSGSKKDNVRPYVVRNAPENVSGRVLWMNTQDYKTYKDYKTSIKTNIAKPKFSSDLTGEKIHEVMKAVADWQIGDFDNGLKGHYRHPMDWLNATLYQGIFACGQSTEDNKYIKWFHKIARKYRYQPYSKMYHADDIAVSYTHVNLYRLKKDERMLLPTKARLDWVIENPSQSDLLLDYRDHKSLQRWSWCDALFMAPPVYAQMAKVTGEKKYLKFMHKEFKATYDFLYDKEESLFFRDHRYFEKREANGEKVFWGRGNGWVLGGIIPILKELPAKSKYRSFYEELFVEMVSRIAELQDENGFWHASLLDPESYPNPETSSTGFYCYALAWGVNNGYLDAAKYRPIAEKSWNALVSAVHTDGMLGWVQPVGADPQKVTKDMTEVYGVGSFLLAGSEIYKMVQ